MARRKKTIKQNREKSGEKKLKTKIKMTNMDKGLFINLAKSGRTTSEIAKTYGVSQKRLSKLKNHGLLTSEPLMKDGEVVKCYRLTDRGKAFVKREIPEIRALYKPVREGSSHDIRLSALVSELLPEQQLIAMVETELTEKFGHKGRYSTPDLYVPAVEIDGVAYEERILEITTRNYTKELIQSKLDYAQHIMKSESVVEFYYAK